MRCVGPMHGRGLKPQNPGPTCWVNVQRCTPCHSLFLWGSRPTTWEHSTAVCECALGQLVLLRPTSFPFAHCQNPEALLARSAHHMAHIVKNVSMGSERASQVQVGESPGVTPLFGMVKDGDATSDGFEAADAAEEAGFGFGDALCEAAKSVVS